MEASAGQKPPFLESCCSTKTILIQIENQRVLKLYADRVYNLFTGFTKVVKGAQRPGVGHDLDAFLFFFITLEPRVLSDTTVYEP